MTTPAHTPEPVEVPLDVPDHVAGLIEELGLTTDDVKFIGWGDTGQDT